MIEKRVALDDIDAILERAAELGVDMTQWGPSDYGFSFDERPNPEEIREAEERVIAKSLEYNVAPRIEIGAVEQAQRYLDLGVKHFCIGWDRFPPQPGLHRTRPRPPRTHGRRLESSPHFPTKRKSPRLSITPRFPPLEGSCRRLKGGGDTKPEPHR